MIFGSSGMKGHMIINYLKFLKKYDVLELSHEKKLSRAGKTINIEDKDSVKDIIEKENPDYIINCIGTLVRESDKNPSKAIYYNSYFPHFLEDVCKESIIKIIQLSTDCVFSGSKGAYKESDFKDGTGFYALSKSLGEILNNKDLTIRSSSIGPELKENGEGLFHFFMSQKGEINGFSKAYWSGITTLELAKILDCFIDKNLHGLYHIAPVEKISKFELLKLIQEIWEKNDVKIIRYDEYCSDKSLITEKDNFNYTFKSYKEMLVELHEWMNIHKDLYHYYDKKK